MPEVIGLSKKFSGFDPRSLHGCCLWADAASITGIASGTSVSGVWSNLANTYISGQNVRFGISCTGTLNVGGRNSKNTVLFNTSQTFDMTASAGTVNLSNYSLFFSGRQTGGTKQRVLTSAASQNQLFGYWGGAKKNLYVENDPSQLYASPSDTVWDVMSHTRFTSGAYTFKWNGSQLYSGTSSTATLLLGLFINRQEASDCEVGEIILYNRVLESADVETVERYLCAKWGVGLNATLPLIPSMSTFVPALLNPNCILWLDAADTSTYTYSSGATITGSWYDKSGNGNHAIASGVASTRLPSCSSNANTNVFGTINNLPALVFAQASPNPLMKTTSNIPTYPLTVFVVASFIGTPGVGQILMDNFGGQRQIFAGASGTFPQTVYFEADSTYYRFQGCVRVTDSNIPFLISAVITNTVQWTSYGNGNITAGNNPLSGNATSLSQWYIGGANNGIYSCGASIGEIIICKTALSTSDRQQTEAYLIQKWGINPSSSLVTNTTPAQTYVAIPYPAISNKYTWPQPANRSFSATDLGGCVQWMDAYNVNGFLSNQPANNAAISAWQDSSGIKAFYGYSNAFPIYRATGLNSRPTIDFTGGAGMVSCNASTVYQTEKSSNVTVFIVGQVNSGIANWGTVWGHFSAGRHDYDIQLRQNGLIPSTLNWHTNNDNGAGMSIAYTIGTPYLMVCTMSNASVVSFTQYLSSGTSTNVNTTEGVSWAAGIAPIWLGISDSTSEYYNGYISEVIYYQRVLPTTEQGVVIGYLAQKWGFTLPTTATAPDTIYQARAMMTIPTKGFATDGLMYYLSADDSNSWNGTATWTDLMGTGVNMNLTGTTTPTLTDLTALYGIMPTKWVNFSSASAQYGYTTGEFQRSVYLKWTVEVWILMTNAYTGTNPAIVTSKFSGTWNNVNYMLGAYSSGPPKLSAAYYVPGWVSSAGIQMAWGIHHVVATYDGANLNLYQNGNLVTQSASTYTPGWSGGNASGGIYIMRRWDGAEYFSGALNTVRIYNRALSASEVLKNFVSESKDRGWGRVT